MSFLGIGCLTLSPYNCTQRSTQTERGLVIGGGRSSSKLPEGTVTWGPTLRFLREPWLSAYPFCEQFLRLKANFANNKILLLINFNRYRFKYSESCKLGSLNPLFASKLWWKQIMLSAYLIFANNYFWLKSNSQQNIHFHATVSVFFIHKVV